MKHDILLNDDLSYKINSLIYEYKLNLYGIDYYSFGFNDHQTGLSYSFSSRPEWFDFLRKDQEAGSILLNHDYVWKNSFKFHDHCIINNVKYNERTYLLSSFDYSSNIHKEMIRYKKMYHINRGMGYLEHYNQRSFSSNFYTNYSKFDELNFAIIKRNLIKNIHNMSKRIVMEHFNISFLPRLLEHQIQVPRLLYLDHKFPKSGSKHRA